MEDLISRYRPKVLDRVWGNEEIKRNWRARMKRRDPPHSVILVGEPGLGKTTLARIFCDEIVRERLALYRGCALGGLIRTTGKQYIECDSSQAKDYDSLINFIITTRYYEHPAYVCYVDEAHRLTEKFQTPFLKPTEDRENLYLIFSTTEMEKIIETLRQRSVIYTVEKPSMSVLMREVGRIAKKEGLNLLPDALEYLIILSNRIPRDCLINLGKLFDLKGPITKQMVQDSLQSKVGSFHLPRQ